MMIRIQQLRSEKGLSMRKAAQELNMPYTTYISYEKGDREPNSETLIKLANYFDCTIDYLIGRSSQRRNTPSESSEISEILSIPNILPLPKTKKIPLVGTIACGEPITAVENIEDYVGVPESVRADFCLRCKGDSMINARIFDGDIVYIRQQPDVENGEIAAVLIEDEATLKRVFKHKDSLELRAENPTFPPMYFEGAELEGIRILGKAVAFLSGVR